MGLFERKIRPAYVTAPVEPPAPVEVRIAKLDDHLAVIAEMPRGERPEIFARRADWLLDQRNAIRPGRPRPVPVSPGRIDSIIDNRRENP